MDPGLILGAFGLNIASVVLAAWRIGGVLSRIETTLSFHAKDVGRIESRLTRLEGDVQSLADKMRQKGAA